MRNSEGNGRGKRRIRRVLTVCGAVFFCAVCVACVLIAGATVQYAVPAAGQVAPAVPETSAVFALSDEQAMQEGSVLDDTGISLMSQNFVFASVDPDQIISAAGASQTAADAEGALMPGMHAPEVAELKARLMELGYMEEDEPTDYYGPQTAYSVQLFQRSHGLDMNGIADAQTLALLHSDRAKVYMVSAGQNGTDVEELQKRLKELGYLPANITGYFGTDTQTAVQLFQTQHGLTADGKVGSRTRELLYSEKAQAYVPTPTKTSTPIKTSAPIKTSTPTKTTKPTKTAAPTKTVAPANTATKTTQPTKSVQPTTSVEPGTDKQPDTARVEALIAYAKTLLGKPYVLGGKGPDVFDCSGFVYWCLNQTGYEIRYMTSGGWANSSFPKVTRKQDLLPGDIICFNGHVGIYLGNNSMIDASSDKGQIRIATNLWSSNYWNKNFICGRRVLYQ